jgi:hypothetical protein
MICTHCWKPSIVPYKDVSKLWNNPKDTSYVCSEECHKELKQSLKDGTWMEWNDKMREHVPKRSGLDK